MSSPALNTGASEFWWRREHAAPLPTTRTHTSPTTRSISGAAHDFDANQWMAVGPLPILCHKWRQGERAARVRQLQRDVSNVCGHTFGLQTTVHISTDSGDIPSHGIPPGWTEQ